MNASFSLRALPQGVISFIREARQELQTVQWPTRRNTVRSTTAILVVSTAVAAVAGFVDAGLVFLVQRLLSR